ncbi:MAG: sugar transferase, partial [Pseudomonadota bacterium]
MLDLALLLVVAIPALCLATALTLWLLAVQGRPVFYISERIGLAGRPFRLWKFRSMRAAADAGIATGGDKDARVTRAGAWLRARRLDELPQLWNVLRGDMGFVGPRPPLRRYVARHAPLYAGVLAVRPGLTGLATLIYHRHEARLLAGCDSEAATDRLYSRRCVPRKARLDLIYVRRAGAGLDLAILMGTLRALVSAG